MASRRRRIRPASRRPSVAVRLRRRLEAIPLPPGHVRGLAASLLVVGVLTGGFLLARDSSFFAVRHVRVTGATGPAAPRIAAALRAAADGMTTLHVDRSALRRSLSGFSQVRDVQVHREGRNGLRLQVVEYAPVAVLAFPGRRIPVTDDGALLRKVTPDPSLPVIPVSGAAGGERIVDRDAQRALSVLQAGPASLRARVQTVTAGPRGMSARLREGPDLYFGGPERLRAKWSVAAALMADPESRGARYVDVRVPERPAVGGFPVEASPTSTGPGTSSPTSDETSTDPSSITPGAATDSPSTSESAANGGASTSGQG